MTEIKVKNPNRIKLRAHHLYNAFWIKDKPPKDTKEIFQRNYNLRAYGGMVQLLRAMVSNPDLKVEISDDYDDVCASCPSGPNNQWYKTHKKPMFKPVVINGETMYVVNRSGQGEHWGKTDICRREGQRVGDRKVLTDILGLSVGQVLKAIQVRNIAWAYDRYCSHYCREKDEEDTK